MIVAIEGWNGSGKTTLIENLKLEFQSYTPWSITTSAIFQRVQNELAFNKTLTGSDLRYEIVFQVLSELEQDIRERQKAYPDGIIFLDRYIDSLRVYNKVDVDDLGYMEPDMTICITTPPYTCLRGLAGQNLDQVEQMSISEQNYYYVNFLQSCEGHSYFVGGSHDDILNQSSDVILDKIREIAGVYI